MYVLGLDIGSAASKAAVLRILDGSVAALATVPCGIGSSGPQRAIDEALATCGATLSDIAATVTTGYGRAIWQGANKQMSELSCHARGAARLVPQARTVIDIGGQDVKILQLKDGRLLSFVMNDKCAAGTGRFLEVMAHVLETRVEELAALSAGATATCEISSTCTVFAETEVVSRLAQGAPKADVCAGIHRSVAKRVCGLAQRVTPQPIVVMTGGVAQNAGVVSALEAELHLAVTVPEHPQLAGALGAALYALELVNHIN